MNKYTRLFIDETRLYLDTIQGALPVGPERGEGDLKDGRRLAHSIKGMALFEEQSAIAGLAYALEQGMEALDGEVVPPRLVAHLETAVEHLRRMIDDVERDGKAKGDPAPIVEAIVGEIG